MVEVRVESRWGNQVIKLPAVPRIGEKIYLNYDWCEVKHVGYVPNDPIACVVVE